MGVGEYESDLLLLVAEVLKLGLDALCLRAYDRRLLVVRPDFLLHVVKGPGALCVCVCVINKPCEKA